MRIPYVLAMAGAFAVAQTQGCESDADGDDWTTEQGDCDDQNAAVYPGAEERCDGLDNDCDEAVDEDAVDVQTWYQDGDGDGYGVDTVTLVACTAPDGYTQTTSDCNDSSVEVNPGAEEVCNFIDDDCDGQLDEGFDGNAEECPPIIDLAVDAQNVNVAELLGYPSEAIQARVIIHEGVTISSDSPQEPALSTAGLASGSIIFLINSGTIHGRGGDGACSGGGAGEAGGDAIQSTVDLVIDNSLGAIFGGGGGGGSGDDPTGGGGGAGGGLGCDGGGDAVGGVGGHGGQRYDEVPGGDGAHYDGSPGVGGAVGNPGSGGGGGSGGAASLHSSQGCCDGQGGAGGGWGGGGGGGTGYNLERNPGPGGDAGYAIRVLDGSLTWQAGYTLEQVKGSAF